MTRFRCIAGFAVLIAFAQGLSGCSKFKIPQDIQIFSTDAEQAIRVRALHTVVQSIDVEVIYETGAEPYTGKIKDYPFADEDVDPESRIKNFEDLELWQLTRHNVIGIFQDRIPDTQIKVPLNILEMKEIPSLGQNSYSLLEIQSLAEQHRITRSSGTHASFVLVFLNGKLRDADGNISDSVIGVSLGGTDITAIFKPMILSQGQTEVIRAFSEQTTVVHELGHAIGLVANGMPMVKENHQDAVNGHHCNNPECVMYYKVSAMDDLHRFIENRIKKLKTLMLWDEACMRDVSEYK